MSSPDAWIDNFQLATSVRPQLSTGATSDAIVRQVQIQPVSAKSLPTKYADTEDPWFAWATFERDMVLKWRREALIDKAVRNALSPDERADLLDCEGRPTCRICLEDLDLVRAEFARLSRGEQ